MAEKRKRNEEFVEQHHLLDLIQFMVTMVLFEKPEDVDGYCEKLLTDIIDGRYEKDIPLYTEDEIGEMFKQYLLPNSNTIESRQAKECLLSMGIPEYIANEFFGENKLIETKEFTEKAILALHKRIAQWK